VIIKARHISSYNFECLEFKLWAFGCRSNFKTYLIYFGLYKSPKIPTHDLHHANNETFNYKYDLALQEIMVYFIRKLNQELVILTSSQFDHLTILHKSIWTCPTWLVVFFTDHKMIFFTSQIGQKIWVAKNIN